MISSHAVLREAQRFAGEKYVFASEIDHKPANYVGPVDCSELVQHACKRAGVTPPVPDGAYWQWLATRQLSIPIDQARVTHGALMFMGDGVGTGRDAIFHVAFSLGDGRTFEARSKSYGVGIFPRRNGWTYAAKIPGVLHDAVSPIAPTPPPAVHIKEPRPMTTTVYTLSGIIAYVDLTYQRWGRTPGQELKNRMYWVNKARNGDPASVLDEMVATFIANEGDRE